jgi:Uncharacterized conserved protein
MDNCAEQSQELSSLIRKNMETQNNNTCTPKKPKLQYPINFDIKLIISAEYPVDSTKSKIDEVFEECHVASVFNNVRASSKGNYLSYSFNVLIIDKEQMDITYESLKEIPGLKFAL